MSRRAKSEGKSLLDAMRDGSEDGMQCFDDEIEKLIRANVIDIETGLSYSTNDGNLRFAGRSARPSPGGLIESSHRGPTTALDRNRRDHRTIICWGGSEAGTAIILVDVRGLEPLTSSLRTRRSPN